METRRKTIIVRLRAAAIATAALAVFQLPSCSASDLQQGLLQGVTLSVANDVFTAAQTILQNIFRV